MRVADPVPSGPRPGDSGRAPFAGPEEVHCRLLAEHYLSDPSIDDAVFLAERIGKPVLVEGPAGVGKTELAKSVARATGRRLIRLQCYEGLDEAKALYEWDYRKQLVRLQAERGADGGTVWKELSAGLFSEEYLLARPLLEAILVPVPVVLLIDEVARIEPETEAMLLEVLSDFQVSLPELLGTLRARSTPLLFLTSNGTRGLSEALRRRCLYLPSAYPTRQREAENIRLRVPEIDRALAAVLSRIVATLREMDLRKPPSISESIDWARALTALQLSPTDEAVARTLTLLIKDCDDLHTARVGLGFDTNRPSSP